MLHGGSFLFRATAFATLSALAACGLVQDLGWSGPDAADAGLQEARTVNAPEASPTDALPGAVGPDAADAGADATAADAAPLEVDASAMTARRRIDIASDHVCAITPSGGVKCWGDESDGWRATQYPDASLVPVDVPGLTSAAIGLEGDCAILKSGKIECWSAVTLAADGGAEQRSDVPSNVTAIVLDWDSCLLSFDGGMKCWGENRYGQIGDGTTSSSQTPVDVFGLASGVSSMVVGRTTCAVTSSGAAKCWGLNDYGEVGNGTAKVNFALPMDVTGLSSGVAALAGGEEVFCALMKNGAVKCWGQNWEGALGIAAQSSPLPVVIGLPLPATQVAFESTADSFVCAVTVAGSVMCWGGGSYQPRLMPGLTSDIASLAMNYQYRCALTTTGGVKCAGANQVGQLGNGTTAYSGAGVDVVGLGSGVDSLALGWHTACAYMKSGGIKCWGENVHGLLGNGTTTNSTVPVDVVGFP